MSEFDDLFNEFLNNSPEALPPPTPEQERLEAMTATELHLTAFYEATESKGDNWHEMLPQWLEELAYYLPVLEDYEEYEQCAKVFKGMREVREVHNNLRLTASLHDLKINVVHESDNPELNDDGLDF
jgi:hypothetical protein